MLKSGGLPEPEGPKIEMYSPRLISSDTPLSARSVWPPMVLFDEILRPHDILASRCHSCFSFVETRRRAARRSAA